MENNIINVLKNNFNISIGNYDGINVFAYGENNSVVYPEDYARKRVAEIEEAKADRRLVRIRFKLDRQEYSQE